MFIKECKYNEKMKKKKKGLVIRHTADDLGNSFYDSDESDEE